MIALIHGRIPALWLAGLLVSAWPSDAAAAGGTLAADGRTFTITAPGLTSLQGGFAASIKVGDQLRELSSADGVAAGLAEHLTETTPHGVAGITATTIRFEKEQVELMLRLGSVPGGPGVLAQAGIRNTGKEPVSLVAVTPLAMVGRVTGQPADWFVTALLPNYERSQSVDSLDEIHEPLHVEEYGSFYRRDGTGFLFGPVGTPIAFLHTYIQRENEGRVRFRVAADMSGVRVDPGETRWGQQVALLMSPPRTALACWAEWVAKTHGARISKNAVSGWSSWYFLGREVTGKDVLDVTTAALKSPDRLHPDVIQIDTGFEDPSGKQETNDKFPEGLAFYAQHIIAAGARPGLRIRATGPWNADEDRALAEVLDQCRRAVRNGFTYFRFSLNYKSTPFVSGHATARMTSFETLRKHYAEIRNALGPDIYLMCCDTWPSRAEIGAVDASRTGRAASRLRVKTSAMGDVLRSYQLQGRWFNVDNEGYYMGTDLQNISAVDGGWPLVRTWMSMVGLSCGAAITSDPWHWEDFKPYVRNVEVLTPPAKERTEVMDLCTSRDWPRLVSHVTRDWGDMTVALLWNPGNTERTVTLDFAEAGLDPHRRYAVWSFWDNRYLGVAEKEWTTLALAPSASQHLRFTDLDRAPDRPVLIGSNLHVFCGAAEITGVTSTQSSMKIELGEAGARAGDLYVYSRLPLALSGSTGCAVNGISSAGEYVWRIGIANRQHGVPQRVELNVMLPITRQAWFWMLIALVVASLLFGAWRYGVSLRLQRVHALDQERTRIARDLHDDLGAGLTEIAMLSDVARRHRDQPEVVNVHLERIFRSGCEMTQALDEIVWAINPSNDTLEKLISFACELAQGILVPAGIQCRLDVPTTVPGVDIDSRTRHQLCMAMKESLHNIVKHSHAREVQIRIILSGQMLDMMIADDGAGFDPADLTNPTGNCDGLRNLRQRMADIHGTCEIQSASGQGTRVRLQVKI